RRAFAANLSRFAGIVNVDTLSARFLGRRLKHAEAFLFRDPRYDSAKNLHRISLLKTVQAPRRRVRLDARECRNGNKLSFRPLDLQIQEWPDGCAILVPDLRDHFVAAIVVVKRLTYAPPRSTPSS